MCTTLQLPLPYKKNKSNCTLPEKKNPTGTSPVLCSVREVATLDDPSLHQHAELKICCLQRWRAKHINVFEATVTLWGTNISERSSIRPPLLHVQSSQWLNWKINSNLNDWNKELLESEIKRLSSPRSPLIGKSFLQGILMVLREDCKAKLMSWRRVNSFCMCSCVSALLYVRRVCVLFSCTQAFLLTNGQNEEKSLDQGTWWWLCSRHTGAVHTPMYKSHWNKIFTCFQIRSE